MELKYIILTIIKILISVPAIVLVAPLFAEGAALMGGHLDNKSNSTSFLNLTSSYFNFDISNDQELSTNDSAEKISKHNPKNNSQTLEDDTNQEESEEIPDPSALVVPGYNLPENIFNKGKPFYLEKDPLTGVVDFENKSPNLKVYDDYDYANEEDLESDIYAKANVDRKDGSLSSHKNSDVNQLTPNLYEFLNLPLKYNSDKYVYPLISNSYANTKVQGNVNKHSNHKDYFVTTYKPIKTPTYFPTKSAYFSKESKTTEKMITTPTTTTSTTTTPKTTTQIHLTTKEVNLMDNAMNHLSFTQPQSTQKSKVEDIYLTTEKYQTTYTPTTERIMSLFEQFMAGFNEPVTTTERSRLITPSLPPSVEKEEQDMHNLNGHASPHQNILTGTNMGHQSAYDYDYDEDVTDNIAVENKPTKIHIIMMQNGSALEHQKQHFDIENTKVFNRTEELFQFSLPENKTKPTVIINPDEESNPSYDVYLELTTSMVTTEPSSTPKVTSLPLGENHVAYNNPIIVATQNLREQLNNEKVIPKPFGFDKPILHPVSGTSNIHIAPDQDTVSFVVGNHQNVDGQYIGTALKESPYDTNPFRPLYAQTEQNLANNKQNTVSYTIQTSQEVYNPSPPQNYDNVKMQPIRNSEASLAIGMPLNLVKGKPGQVVDESSEINNEKIEFPKGNGPKIVFPDEKTTYIPPPSKIFLQPPNKQFMIQPNREVLKLNSQPMFHQLPSDLTPPNEPNMHSTMNRDRPPWDPRPGHFHSGRPEYARPPRPNQNEAFKRIDTLPNILPQFRPNIKHIHKGYVRQPLLDRPSNRPIGFFEKLHPPPPPKLLQNLRKEQESNYRQNIPEERIVTDGYKKTEQFMFYQTPPKMVLATRRNGDEDIEVETLQMLQAKQDKKEKTKIEITSSFQANLNGKDSIEKPIYVVYPVNTPPLKLDAIDTTKKESVVIGTRAELPLPPSKINSNEEEIESFESSLNPFIANQEASKISKNDYKLPPSAFDFQQNDRHDSPILKPHHRPNLPIKSEFPYPLERPDPTLLSSLLNSAPVETTGNDLENHKFSSNQWNSLDDTESRIVTGSKINTQSNQISVKLKTYTEKPIAVAYSPTESHKSEYNDRYSMPNYANPVIPEIRQGNLPSNSPFVLNSGHKVHEKTDDVNTETTHVPQLDFQAPFQASINVDNVSHGWSVIKDKSKEDNNKDETTTLTMSSTSEFDIENFKPQLIGGFKPIYNFPDGENQKKMEVKERQE